jgi:hypothetical protein
MVRALRSTRGGWGVAALTVSALLTVTLSAAAHDGGDDPLCGAAIGAGTPAPTRLAPGHVSAHRAEHCVLCHAAQTVRMEPASSHGAPAMHAAVLTLAATPRVVGFLLGTAQPARAPPRA